jgi:murein DD-endopeptidase MepM/ murein hydrolase activator NlpD
MSGYQRPAEVTISCSWGCHRNRTPPSPEAGTDYATAYGVDIAMAYAGTISVIDTSPGGGEGRRMSVDLDDGRRVSYIHLSKVMGKIGQRVARGQKGVCLSGASGYGSDWYYGPHVHTSLWQRPGMAYADTIDFEKYVGSAPGPTPPPIDRDEDEEMMRGASYPTGGKTVFLLFNESSGWYCEHSGTSGSYNNALAASWETNSWPQITEAHAKVIKTACDKTRARAN